MAGLFDTPGGGQDPYRYPFYNFGMYQQPPMQGPQSLPQPGGGNFLNAAVGATQPFYGSFSPTVSAPPSVPWAQLVQGAQPFYDLFTPQAQGQAPSQVSAPGFGGRYAGTWQQPPPQQGGRPMFGPQPPPASQAWQGDYNPYLPMIMKDAPPAPAPQQQVTREEPAYAPAPENVDAEWYQAFQVEHGETPEEFYKKTGEGLVEALADREWSLRFARDQGRPPDQYEWENHWYDMHTWGGRPQSDPGPGWRRKSRRGATDVDRPRPPLYVPQPTVWRK